MGQTYGVKGGKENAMQVAKLVLERVQDRLESFEIGNEPDLMYLVGHRPENYTVADYVWEWNEYADAASEQVLNANPYGLDETRFFQAGTITEYYDWTVYVPPSGSVHGSANILEGNSYSTAASTTTTTQNPSQSTTTTAPASPGSASAPL
jgi:hypothetical protein